MNAEVPAVVLNSEAHGGLGIVRSLGRLNVSVIAVHRDRFAPAKFSRYAKRSFTWDFSVATASESLGFMEQLAREIGQPAVLFACDDDTAIFVAEHAAALEAWFLFPQSPKGVVSSLASKRGLYELAMLHHMPTAATQFPQSKADILLHARNLTFPVMLKGIDGLRLARRTRKKMVICHTVEELLVNYEELEDLAEPNLMIQEYIPGGAESVWMFNGYFDGQSECLVSFTGQKLRQCPIYTGATSLGICLKNQAVEESVQAFMKAVGYRGMLDVGTRYDARDGQYKVLDVNPRIGATFRLFVDRAGMDVARAYYLHITDQRFPASAVREGRKWIVEDMDASASVHYWQEGTLSFRAWMRSLRGVEEAGYLCCDDPVPVMLRAATVFGNLGARLLRTLAHWFSASWTATEAGHPTKAAGPV